MNGNQTQTKSSDILVTLLGIEPRHYTGHEPAALPTAIEYESPVWDLNPEPQIRSLMH